MVLTLYKLDASPPVRAVYMTIEILNIPDVKLVDVNLFSAEHLKEEYLKLNPQHTIPTLLDDDFAIWDSHAIGSYLVAKYGANDSLYPSDPKKKAVVDQRLHFDTGILFPSLRNIAELVLFAGETSVRPEHLEKVKKAYAFANQFLASSTWLAGEEITLADICCVATISTLDVILPVDRTEFPNLHAWFGRCAEQEFYQKGNAPGLAMFRQFFQSKLA